MSGTHDGGELTELTTEVVASWDEGTFAENLAVSADGTVFVSIHNQNAIVRFDPDTRAVTPDATFPVPVAGLAIDPSGTLWAAGGEIGSGLGYVWRVADGNATEWTAIEGAQFVNGITFAPDGKLLVVDSILGTIYAIYTDRPAISTWLKDERLQPKPGSQTPGANGIKLFGGHAVISVTDHDVILRTAIGADGEAGPLETLAEHLRADDMAFDAKGALYIATHPQNSVVRLMPDGRRSTLGGPAQGLVGATAVAFGRGIDATTLYVTTTGGILAPFEGVVQRAKLVALDIGIPGAPMPYAP